MATIAVLGPKHVNDPDVEFVGNEDGHGAYYKAVHAADGWYLSVIGDPGDEDGSIVWDLLEDEGPYRTAEDALSRGRDVGISYCHDLSIHLDMADDPEGEADAE